MRLERIDAVGTADLQLFTVVRAPLRLSVGALGGDVLDPIEAGDFFGQLAITETFAGACHRTVINQRNLITAALLDMHIQGVVAGIQFTVFNQR